MQPRVKLKPYRACCLPVREQLLGATLAVTAACTADGPAPGRPAGSANPQCDQNLDAAFGAWARAGFSGAVAVSTGGRFECLAGYGAADDATDARNTETEAAGGGELVTSTSGHRSEWVTWTVLALAPVAAALAWGLAGRAVRDIERVRAVAENIEAVDLTRRVGLSRGPSEVVRLAASIDAMLGRLEQAAETQRRLIEETSHELRTPLSVLMANAEVLLAHPNPSIEV